MEKYPSREEVRSALTRNAFARVQSKNDLRKQGFRFTDSWFSETAAQVEFAMTADDDPLSEVSQAVFEAAGNVAAAKKALGVDNVADARNVVNEEGSSEAQAIMDTFELNRKLLLQRNINNTLRRQIKDLTSAAIAKQGVIDNIAESVKEVFYDIDRPYLPYVEFKRHISELEGKPITLEVLFSDIQIGKLMTDYDSKIAEARLVEWLDVLHLRIGQYMALGYKIEKIVFACLGDVIESDKKHSNSGRACDIGTADQMKLSIEWLFNKVIMNLATVGAPMDVIMVTGNHDHDGHGRSMFMPGREHLSWPLYHAVRMLTEAAGIDAEFFIPGGAFHVHSVYGANILYEHGVGVATSEAAMRKHVANRINQGKEYIHLFRMGDKHNICRFNNDRFTVNGAFFGDDRIGSDYSGISGYDGEPAQIMFAYVNRTDNRRTPIFDSLVIQLGHIK